MGGFIQYNEYEIDDEHRKNTMRKAEQYRLAATVQSSHPWRMRKWVDAVDQFITRLAARVMFGPNRYKLHFPESHSHYRQRRS